MLSNLLLSSHLIRSLVRLSTSSSSSIKVILLLWNILYGILYFSKLSSTQSKKIWPKRHLRGLCVLRQRVPDSNRYRISRKEIWSGYRNFTYGKNTFQSSLFNFVVLLVAYVIDRNCDLYFSLNFSTLENFAQKLVCFIGSFV